MAALENESFCRCCGKCKMNINGELICTDYLFYGMPVENSLIEPCMDKRPERQKAGDKL